MPPNYFIKFSTAVSYINKAVFDRFKKYGSKDAIRYERESISYINLKREIKKYYTKYFKKNKNPFSRWIIDVYQSVYIYGSRFFIWLG